MDVTLAVALPAGGARLGEIPAAKIKHTGRLDGADQLTFALQADVEAAQLLDPFVTDAVLYVDSDAKFRGRTTAPKRTLSATVDSLDVDATCYRGLLSSRLLEQPVSVSGVSQHAAGWALLTATQAADTLGIADSTEPSGLPDVTITWPVGTNVGKALADLGRLDGAGEWDVDADLRWRTWPAGGRGDPNADELVWGSDDLVSVDLVPDVAEFASAVLVEGADGTTATFAKATDPPEGLWYRQVSDRDLDTAALLTSRAAGELAARYPLRTSITAKVTDDRWQLGDTVVIDLPDGVRHVRRVVQRVATYDLAADHVDVELTFDAPPPDLARLLHRQGQRLDDLERNR